MNPSPSHSSHADNGWAGRYLAVSVLSDGEGGEGGVRWVTVSDLGDGQQVLLDFLINTTSFPPEEKKKAITRKRGEILMDASSMLGRDLGRSRRDRGVRQIQFKQTMRELADILVIQ